MPRPSRGDTPGAHPTALAADRNFRSSAFGCRSESACSPTMSLDALTGLALADLLDTVFAALAINPHGTLRQNEARN